jgi:hypothetical protein
MSPNSKIQKHLMNHVMYSNHHKEKEFQ